ncbi:hypothetical protein DB346_06315 [Verrucomicrobia bacterium LW23]|nr:hypothetical protein DB346_06315 [Verrucomicrobia bacterium LW23]
MTIPEDISESQFRQIGSILAKVQRSIQWYWGDWLAHASQSAHKSRSRNNLNTLVMREGPRLYQYAGELSHLSYQTLRNYKAVCEAIPLPRRRPNLSFGHHEAVHGIPDVAEQDEWLEEAERERWSISQLRAAIRIANSTAPLDYDGNDRAFHEETRRRSQIMREIDVLTMLLKKERVEDFPPRTQDAWLEKLEPIARFYDKLYCLHLAATATEA